MRWTTLILLCLAVALQIFDGGTEPNPLATWVFAFMGAKGAIMLLDRLFYRLDLARRARGEGFGGD